ncbi:hypothetical protein WMY93_019038 [Mugilogobius chulae]|uniref:Uncharacterized protein n=1 Tax=Mugilogobius chulae TaxID=88201 RepID=A0AAW0ND08_9GOBI
MPPGRLPGPVPPRGDLEEDPGYDGRTMSLDWPGNASGFCRKSWRNPEVEEEAGSLIEALQGVDLILGQLMNGLQQLNLHRCINIIIVADHGMEEQSCDRKEALQDFVGSIQDFWVTEGPSGRVRARYKDKPKRHTKPSEFNSTNTQVQTQRDRWDECGPETRINPVSLTSQTHREINTEGPLGRVPARNKDKPSEFNFRSTTNHEIKTNTGSPNIEGPTGQVRARYKDKPSESAEIYTQTNTWQMYLYSTIPMWHMDAWIFRINVSVTLVVQQHQGIFYPNNAKLGGFT